jgi:predicted DNA binding CopG/RHH family protein
VNHNGQPDLEDSQIGAQSNEKAKFAPQIQSRGRRADVLGHDSTDDAGWSKSERVRFPNLKPSTTAISIRLPLGLLEQIKIAANKRDVPYQSLIKMWLAEKVG